MLSSQILAKKDKRISMKQTLLKCPACGAPVTVNEGESKITCSHCGQASVLEGRYEENFGTKVASTIQESESKTQLEIKRLQLSQELSMLQMQLSNLRTEKRSLERENNSASRYHLKQINEEERSLVNRISDLKNALMPQSEPGSPLPRIDTDSQYVSSGYSNKSWGTTLFLAFTMGILGIHRYYVGRIGSAVIQTFTVGGFYIWWIADIIAILRNKFTDSMGRPLNREIKANRTLMKVVGGIYIWFFLVYAIIGGNEDPSTGLSFFTIIGLPIIIAVLLNAKSIFHKAKGILSKD